MSNINTEDTFESAIELSLLEKGNYTKGNSEDYSPELGLFKYAFEDKFMNAFISRMDQNKDIFEKMMKDKEMGAMVREMMMMSLYRRFNE